MACADAIAARAAAVEERSDAVVPEVAVVAGVVAAVVADADDVAVDVVPVAALPAAAMQPVRTSIPAMLSEPAILRARRAGWGRFRRGPFVFNVSPRLADSGGVVRHKHRTRA